MPKRSRTTDPILLASRTFKNLGVPPKNPAAVALGKLGGAKVALLGLLLSRRGAGLRLPKLRPRRDGVKFLDNRCHFLITSVGFPAGACRKMTETEKIEMAKEVLLQREQAQKEVAHLEVNVERIAGGLQRIVNAMLEHPKLVTSTPAIDTVYDPRNDLKFIDRQLVLEACRDLTKAREVLRLAEKHSLKLQFGSPQTRIEIGEDEGEDRLG